MNLLPYTTGDVSATSNQTRESQKTKYRAQYQNKSCYYSSARLLVITSTDRWPKRRRKQNNLLTTSYVHEKAMKGWKYRQKTQQLYIMTAYLFEYKVSPDDCINYSSYLGISTVAFSSSTTGCADSLSFGTSGCACFSFNASQRLAALSRRVT